MRGSDGPQRQQGLTSPSWQPFLMRCVPRCWLCMALNWTCPPHLPHLVQQHLVALQEVMQVLHLVLQQGHQRELQGPLHLHLPPPQLARV